MSQALQAEEPKDYFEPKSLFEFLERDERRILKKFEHDESAIGEEVVFSTRMMVYICKIDLFKRAYNNLFDDIIEKVNTLKREGTELVCKKVEFIPPYPDCGITGSMFHFKLTFVKKSI